MELENGAILEHLGSPVWTVLTLQLYNLSHYFSSMCRYHFMFACICSICVFSESELVCIFSKKVEN